MITVRIEGEKATSLTLQRLMAQMRDQSTFFLRWSNKTAKMAQDSARSHTRGGNFWPSIARQTKVTSRTSTGAVITCAHFAGAKKEYGGTILPKNKQYLTIPLCAEARRKPALDFKDTFIGGNIRNGKEQAVIFQGIKYGRGKNKSGWAKPLFVLLKSVNPPAEPWWPKAGPVLDQGIIIAQHLIDRELGK